MEKRREIDLPDIFPVFSGDINWGPCGAGRYAQLHDGGQFDNM